MFDNESGVRGRKFFGLYKRRFYLYLVYMTYITQDIVKNQVFFNLFFGLITQYSHEEIHTIFTSNTSYRL